MNPNQSEKLGPRIVALNRDVFFGVRLKQLGAALGYAVELAPDAEQFVDRLAGGHVALGIIDINAAPDWSVIAAEAREEARPPILAFGPHMDVDGLRAARRAGVTRVVSNGQFHREAAELIARYAAAPEPADSDTQPPLDPHRP